jgi:cation diffusion facilitator CzcD-associated flavoprotein CzcO
MNDTSRRICVIGAGMSGLAALRGLLRAGHEVTCFEAGSGIGGMWRYENDNGLSAAYASLHANTSRRRMQFPSLPMRSAPEFPHHTDMLAYLEDYARSNNLLPHVTFSAWVESVEPSDGSWAVTLREGRSQRFSVVVVASGHYWDPHVPKIPGQFSGTTLHVRDYRTADPFAGKRVIVAALSRRSISSRRSPPWPSGRSWPRTRCTTCSPGGHWDARSTGSTPRLRSWLRCRFSGLRSNP